ncbi:hypothetical protein NWP22_01175 [Anabaenopsis tanganyikae CS-531]|uniref:Uncharacterized protein n=1 Tax=Anabaenopsis tanganyikae CS-531 TaxID=2785304 RepID=A0ABT6K9L3_9CYAN|nr:hypothetical protein [Anabaenopsis tanganyikae]MDH6104507.1 hypothetical protein [Anabaenopsis tanganyikae CS-531]
MVLTSDPSTVNGMANATLSLSTPLTDHRQQSTVNGMANATLSLSTPLTDHRQPSTVYTASDRG